VKADFNYSTPCTNTTTVFQDNSIASSSAANTRSWNFGGPLASGLTVSRTYTATGPYNVSLTVNVNGCISTKTKIVTIFSPPISNFTVPTICAKDTVTLVNSSLAQSGILSSFNWKLNGNTFSSVSNPTLALMAPGNYPVKLTVTNSYGCTDSISKSLLVNSLPNAAFTTNPPDYYYLNEPVQFIPVVTNAASYNWSLGNGSTSTLQSPSISFNSENSFTVSLTLSDAQGCQNSLTKTIFISKRFLDLALLNISSIKDDDGFITVVADIANYGTVKASQMELQYQISDGGTNKENWSGVLNPNAFFTYTFNSKSVSDQTNANPITCVTIKKVNGGMDERLDNNELCSALIYDEISVLNPFPNPTYENLNIPVILNKDAEISLTIYNSTGQLIQEKTGQKGTAGLTFISIPTITYSWGTYLIKITIDDKVFIKKFVKAN
jgi:PKD repeat protein